MPGRRIPPCRPVLLRATHRMQDTSPLICANCHQCARHEIRSGPAIVTLENTPPQRAQLHSNRDRRSNRGEHHSAIRRHIPLSAPTRLTLHYMCAPEQSACGANVRTIPPSSRRRQPPPSRLQPASWPATPASEIEQRRCRQDRRRPSSSPPYRWTGVAISGTRSAHDSSALCRARPGSPDRGAAQEHTGEHPHVPA